MSVSISVSKGGTPALKQVVYMSILRSHESFTMFSELFLLAGFWEPLTGHVDMFQVKSAYKNTTLSRSKIPVIHAIKDTLNVNMILFKYFIHVYTYFKTL